MQAVSIRLRGLRMSCCPMALISVWLQKHRYMEMFVIVILFHLGSDCGSHSGGGTYCNKTFCTHHSCWSGSFTWKYCFENICGGDCNFIRVQFIMPQIWMILSSVLCMITLLHCPRDMEVSLVILIFLLLTGKIHLMVTIIYVIFFRVLFYNFTPHS